MFKVGDVIRNKRPYFGEACGKISKLNVNDKWIEITLGNCKFGRWDRWNKRGEDISIPKADLKYFRKAYFYERFYLWVLGNVVSAWRFLKRRSAE